MVERLLISVLLLPIALVCQASDTTQPSGVVAGHLKIISLETVAPADGKVPTVTPETYQNYPLVVLTQDGHRVAGVTADGHGNFRVTLPAGSYVLDIQDRLRKHVRAKPAPFSVTANQTTHVNMEMDTGIR